MNETPLLGMVIKDRYRIERELGRGGFGAVFLASDQQLMDRPVVVKILLEQGVSDTWFQRKFAQEIEALSRINHPGIVSVIDTGELPEGQPYMVQQFVEGSTLRHAIKPGGMDLVRVARIVRKVGQALTAAHQRGVVHRDLKPDNIMLQTLADGDEHATIIDFGIASVSDFPENAPEKTKVTGTFTYMAPEQFDGHPSPASDIYALGIIAFEMLAGAPPNSGKPLFELMLMQKEGHWPKISELRPSVPEATQSLILKALSRKPEDRFESASAFGDELARSLVSKILETGEILPDALPPRPHSMRRWIWAACGVVAAVALIAMAASVTPKPVVVAKKIESTPQPTMSLALPDRVYSYWVTGQHYDSGRSTSFVHANEENSHRGDRINLEIEFAQDGYFYAINQTPEASGALSFYSTLYPSSRTPGYSPKVKKSGNLKIPDGSKLSFEKGKGSLWLIFSHVSLPALENLQPGIVNDPATAKKISAFLQPLRDRQPILEADTRLSRTEVRSADNVVVQRIDLSKN